MDGISRGPGSIESCRMGTAWPCSLPMTTACSSSSSHRREPGGSGVEGPVSQGEPSGEPDMEELARVGVEVPDSPSREMALMADDMPATLPREAWTPLNIPLTIPEAVMGLKSGTTTSAAALA
eukprot:scaffold318456_cov36-Prasinocladus_malaysianus.AAC.2